MKKKLEAQKYENERVIKEWKEAEESLYHVPWFERQYKPLRSCSASVYDGNGYYFLKSYNTIVAIIEKSTGICFDMLRYVFGYTATSAQHIAKFCEDYSAREKLTYYLING